MSWRQVVKDYLTFSRRDRIGMLAFLALIAAIYLLPRFFASRSDTAIITEDPVLQQAVDTLQQRQAAKSDPAYANTFPNAYQYEPSSPAGSSVRAELFAFDPNTLSLADWKRLGLNDKTVRTIDHYRSKGGRFYQPEDLQKIWGLPAGFYDRVKSYIRIAPAAADNTHMPPSGHIATEKKERLAIADINTADTSALIALPGIGSKLASRIINFRDKLGGFYSVEQVAQTYGLPDSTFQHIRPYLHINADAVRKININTATKDELKTHPYIKWNLANAIVEYRNQHGSYKSLEELKNIVLVDETAFSRIAPYLSL